MPRLVDLASTIRSKNAGVDHTTFDILFRERETWERVRASGAITPESVAAVLNIDESEITHFTWFEPANAVKFTTRRQHRSGSIRDTDVYGSQQYASLFDIEVP